MNWLATSLVYISRLAKLHLLTSSCVLLLQPLSAAPSIKTTTEKVKKLQDYLVKEKPLFEERELQRQGVMVNLDRLNSEQNRVREAISRISGNQQELGMAMENLSVEYQKQRELEKVYHARLYGLLRVVYKIKKDGVLKFLIAGHNITQLASRIRILYRTLRSHTVFTKQLEERAKRLAGSERKFEEAKKEQTQLLAELEEHETLLAKLLRQKVVLLKTIEKKQSTYQLKNTEYQRLAKQLNDIFNRLDSSKVAPEPLPQIRGTLPLPVSGHIVQGFGKSIHEKFGTIVYHRGLRIESEHNTPVNSIMDGVIEYAGWVRGLGNVIIIHHGKGLYTLNAHLYKINKQVGAPVNQGETIGSVGDTGNSERPGLYFEIREEGKAVDPVAYFSRDALKMLN